MMELSTSSTVAAESAIHRVRRESRSPSVVPSAAWFFIDAGCRDGMFFSNSPRIFCSSTAMRDAISRAIAMRPAGSELVTLSSCWASSRKIEVAFSACSIARVPPPPSIVLATFAASSTLAEDRERTSSVMPAIFCTSSLTFSASKPISSCWSTNSRNCRRALRSVYRSIRIACCGCGPLLHSRESLGHGIFTTGQLPELARGLGYPLSIALRTTQTPHEQLCSTKEPAQAPAPACPIMISISVARFHQVANGIGFLQRGRVVLGDGQGIHCQQHRVVGGEEQVAHAVLGNVEGVFEFGNGVGQPALSSAVSCCNVMHSSISRRSMLSFGCLITGQPQCAVEDVSFSANELL